MRLAIDRGNVTKLTSAIEALLSQTASKTLFNEVMVIIQHDDWYTEGQRSNLQDVALKYNHFTRKQKARIRNPPNLGRGYDDEYGDDGCPDGVSSVDWDEYCQRQGD